MKINPLFFVKAFLISLAATTAFADAQAPGFGGVIYSDVNAAVNILKKEIARDRELVKPVMSGNQLRRVRARLADGLEKKELLVKSLGKYSNSAIDQAIKIFVSTAEDERKITKGATVSHRLKRQAYYKIKDNIPRKETALRLFEKWLGR